MAKRIETQPEIHVEKQSVILSAKITETEARLSALPGELAAIDQQYDAMVGGEELDTAAAVAEINRERLRSSIHEQRTTD